MSVREITYGAGELVHPQHLNGKTQFISSEVEDIIHKLHYGDPVLGWAGDPRLALYHDEGGSWVLERYEADGQYRTVTRSRPGLPLDERLLIHLMQHDMRGHGGFDPDSLENYEDFTERQRLEEGISEAAEVFAHALAKDLA